MGPARFRARRDGVSITFGEADAALLRELLVQLLELLDEGTRPEGAGGQEAGQAEDAGRPGRSGAPGDPGYAGERADAEPEDPLAALVGIGAPVAPPEDPVLARLLPDAYRDDAEGAADFRRYTEAGLRDAKRAAARTALATLDSPGRRRTLTAAQADAWLRTLTDLRLGLGTRLGVGEDWEEAVDALPEGDPRYYAYAVYDHLTWLQESLVQALTA